MFPGKTPPAPMMGAAPKIGAYVEPAPGGGFKACFIFPSGPEAQRFIDQQKQDGDYPPSGQSNAPGAASPALGGPAASLGALARATGRPLGV